MKEVALLPDSVRALLTDDRTRRKSADTPQTLRPYKKRADWESRAAYIRDHILTCAGLLPLPDKTPLRANIFERIERAGHTVEKVFFESMPGLFVCGNLYRPNNVPKRRHPGIACPHGHWRSGRLQNDDFCSIPVRCMELAQRGFVVFTYDMFGYLDSDQIAHREFGGRREDLWGVGALGIQLWNSIRVVDFLQALPDVDPSRIGCTGASGGGTQTFLLTAVDQRVTASAPVNMVSARYQGGCRCENQGHLRIDINNVEIAAAAAPRPLLLIGASGDWTVDTMDHELPYVQSIYRLYRAQAKVSARRFEADHNYHRGSREEVYGFFERWLLNRRRSRPERTQIIEAEADLRVFARRKRPDRALRRGAVAGALIARAENRLRSRENCSSTNLRWYRHEMAPALEHALGLTIPGEDVRVCDCGRYRLGSTTFVERFLIGRPGYGDSVPVLLLSALPRTRASSVTLLLHSKGKAGGWRSQHPSSLVSALLRSGERVLAVDLFGTGEASARDESGVEGDHFFTYNQSRAACQVQDILTALAFAQTWVQASELHLVATKGTGVVALLARAFAPNVISSCLSLAGFGFDDRGWLKQCFVPAIRSAGDVRTALALIAPGRLYVHGVSKGFPSAWARHLYQSASQRQSFRLSRRAATQRQIVAHIAGGT